MKNEKIQKERHIGLPRIRKDIVKFIMSSPCHFVSQCSTNYFRIEVSDNLRVGDHQSPKFGEAQYRNYFEVSMVVPKERGKILLENYETLAEEVAMFATLISGKMFQSEGVTLCRGRPSVVSVEKNQKKINRRLPIFSERPRVDFKFENTLSNMPDIYGLLINLLNTDSGRLYVNNCFSGAISSYYRGVMLYEEEPMIAYNCFITALESLALYDEEKQTHSKDGVTNKFIKFVMSCLGDEFNRNTESQDANSSIPKSKTKLRRMLCSAYEVRSLYAHTGLYHGSWMSPVYLKNCEEVQPSNILLEDNQFLEKHLRKSPTLIGLERIARYCLITTLKKNGYFDF